MRKSLIRVGIVLALCGAGLFMAGRLQTAETPASTGSGRAKDEAAIRQAGRDFVTAFEKGDAKAVAALWTDQGEFESEDGTRLRGRAAIESAFAAHFKSRPAGKMEIQPESIRFPSRDCAIEEGLTRTTPVGGLPDSAYYRAVHVREDGTWRIALSREWGVAANRLVDLDWLLGSWRSHTTEHELMITFTRDKEHPFLHGEFSAMIKGKSVPLGTMKIGINPSTGLFQSWHFDPDGGHGQGVWVRERNHWVVDSEGQQGDGAATSSVNVLSRFSADELGWRVIDRTVAGRPQPDSPPLRLKRVVPPK